MERMRSVDMGKSLRVGLSALGLALVVSCVANVEKQKPMKLTYQDEQSITSLLHVIATFPTAESIEVMTEEQFIQRHGNIQTVNNRGNQ